GQLRGVRGHHDSLPAVRARGPVRPVASRAELFSALAVPTATDGGPAMTQAPLLVIEKLEVAYHRVITAVQGISLSVRSGQIVALLGTNGAGKTTTLRAISGFLGIDDALVTAGAVTFAGQRIENRAPYETARLGVALVAERDKIFPNLTVSENLQVPVTR